MHMTRMEHKGFFARIKEAVRLTGEGIHGLPAGSDLPVYHADAFNVYHENWMKGPGVFVVPVKPNKGLWFDWRDNDENNTAVIPTVKGCNPITGLQTTGFFLERYDMKCPKHGCDFQAERFCPECGYKWPDRGYVSQSPLWWDGFRSDDGSVRQFFFTEEMMRDVATHMIGKENTVPAFGFAFYSPKEPRPKAVNTVIYKTIHLEDTWKSLVPAVNHVYLSKTLGCDSEVKGKGMLAGGSSTKGFSATRSLKRSVNVSDMTYSASMAAFGGDSGADYSDAVFGADRGIELADKASPITEGLQCSVGEPGVEGVDGVNQESYRERQSYTPQKEVAVGAGAKIRQELPADSYGLDTWKDKPDSVMTIYFVFQEEFDRMAAGGMKKFEDCKDGMLNGLPVG